MRAKRVLIALALAVTGGVGLSANLPSPVAAAAPVKACQTVDLYSVYSAGGGDLSVGWQLTLRQRVVGCWTYSSPTTSITSQDVYLSAFTTWFNNANPDDVTAYGSAGASFYSKFISGGANPTAVGAIYQVNAAKTVCMFGFLCPTWGGTYSISATMYLYANSMVGQPNGGWVVQNACWFQSGANQTDVSNGCSLTGQWMDYLGTTFYYPDTPTPTPTPGQTFPRPGTCSLTAKQNAPIYQAAGSGYSRWLADATQGTQLWVSRSSQLHSQTYFLPILTGTFTGKLIPMSDISIWGGSYWNGTCYT